jgi:hypothetical protein
VLCAWYSRIDKYLLNLGFTKTSVDTNIYYLYNKDYLLLTVLYVDKTDKTR